MPEKTTPQEKAISTKGGPYDVGGNAESPDIHRLAEAILAAIQSRVEPSLPGLSPEEERDVAFGNAALSVITAGLLLEPSPVTVTGLLPANGSAGIPVTILGTNFTPGATVSFGSAQVTPANVNVLSAKEIRATAPAGTGLVDVTVGASAPTNEGRFKYQ